MINESIFFSQVQEIKYFIYLVILLKLENSYENWWIFFSKWLVSSSSINELFRFYYNFDDIKIYIVRF